MVKNYIIILCEWFLMIPDIVPFEKSFAVEKWSSWRPSARRTVMGIRAHLSASSRLPLSISSNIMGAKVRWHVAFN